MKKKIDYADMQQKDEKISYASTIAIRDTLKKFGDKYRVEVPIVPPFESGRNEIQKFWKALGLVAAKLGPKLNDEEKKEIIYVGAAIGVTLDDQPLN